MTSESRNSDKIEQKKAAVMNASAPVTSRIIAFALVAGLFLGGILAWGVVRWTGGETIVADPHSAAASPVAEIFHPVALFEDGAAHTFEFEDQGVTIRYFILKSADGVIRAAFDACDVCWPAGQGYAQDGNHMVCRKCGQKFASILINELRGGCNPAPLERNVKGDQVVLQVQDILAGRKYFDFSGRG